MASVRVKVGDMQLSFTSLHVARIGPSDLIPGFFYGGGSHTGGISLYASVDIDEYTSRLLPSTIPRQRTGVAQMNELFLLPFLYRLTLRCCNHNDLGNDVSHVAGSLIVEVNVSHWTCPLSTVLTVDEKAEPKRNGTCVRLPTNRAPPDCNQMNRFIPLAYKNEHCIQSRMTICL